MSSIKRSAPGSIGRIFESDAASEQCVIGNYFCGSISSKNDTWDGLMAGARVNTNMPQGFIGSCHNGAGLTGACPRLGSKAGGRAGYFLVWFLVLQERGRAADGRGQGFWVEFAEVVRGNGGGAIGWGILS